MCDDLKCVHVNTYVCSTKVRVNSERTSNQKQLVRMSKHSQRVYEWIWKSWYTLKVEGGAQKVHIYEHYTKYKKIYIYIYWIGSQYRRIFIWNLINNKSELKITDFNRSMLMYSHVILNRKSWPVEFVILGVL